MPLLAGAGRGSGGVAVLAYRDTVIRRRVVDRYYLAAFWDTAARPAPRSPPVRPRGGEQFAQTSSFGGRPALFEVPRLIRIE